MVEPFQKGGYLSMDPTTGPVRMVCPRHTFLVPLRLEMWYFWCDQELYVTRLVLFDSRLVVRNDYPWGGCGFRAYEEKPHALFYELWGINDGSMSDGVPCGQRHLLLSANAHHTRCCYHCGVMQNWSYTK